jgi:hypothetical protein
MSCILRPLLLDERVYCGSIGTDPNHKLAARVPGHEYEVREPGGLMLQEFWRAAKMMFDDKASKSFESIYLGRG